MLFTRSGDVHVYKYSQTYDVNAYIQSYYGYGILHIRLCNSCHAVYLSVLSNILFHIILCYYSHILFVIIILRWRKYKKISLPFFRKVTIAIIDFRI